MDNAPIINKIIHYSGECSPGKKIPSCEAQNCFLSQKRKEGKGFLKHATISNKTPLFLPCLLHPTCRKHLHCGRDKSSWIKQTKGSPDKGPSILQTICPFVHFLRTFSSPLWVTSYCATRRESS